MSSAQTSALLAPFLRGQSNLDTLQKASLALEGALRDLGYGLHRVVLPPQELGASVRLNVVKFVIDRVSVTGASHYSEANVRASLPELREGAAPNFRQLAVQTAIANENQSKQVQVVLKASDEADKINAEVQVRDSRAWSGALTLSNSGSQATGLDRLLVSGTHSNVLDRDQQFVGAYTTSVERPGDVRQLGLNYRIPLYAQAGVLSLSHTRSDVVGSFGTFNSSGAGQTLGLTYSHYLPPVGGYRSYLSAGVDDKVFDATLINGTALVGQSPRRSRPLSLGYSAARESDTSVWGYTAEVLINLPGGGGNSLADYRSEDPRITQNRWKLLRGSANYSAAVARGWNWSARTQFQFSGDALISGEQLGLGGTASVRGTEERPLSGDKGLTFALELTSPQWSGLRGIFFLDSGWLANVVSNGSSKPASDHVASLGMGLRYASRHVSVVADWGHVVQGSGVPLLVNTSSPKSGDEKLHVNVTTRF